MSNELFGEVVKTISLDFAQKTSPVTVFAKQGDNRTRIIHIQPLMNGVPMNIDISFQYVAKFAAKKPDGHYVYNDSAKINEDGTITVTLTDQTLAAHGNAICCVILETQSDDVLTSQNFTLIIEFSAGAYQSLASSDEITGLDEKLAQVQELINKLGEEIQGIPPINPEDKDKVLTANEDGTVGWKEAKGGLSVTEITSPEEISVDAPDGWYVVPIGSGGTTGGGTGGTGCFCDTTELEQDIHELEQRVSVLELSGGTGSGGTTGGENTELVQKVVKNTADIAELNQNVGKNAGDISELQNTVSGHTTRIYNIGASLTQTQRELDQLETKVDTYNGVGDAFVNLQNDIDEVEKKVTSLEVFRDGYEENFDDLQSRVFDAEQKVTSLEIFRDGYEENFDDLYTQVNENTLKISILSTDNGVNSEILDDFIGNVNENTARSLKNEAETEMLRFDVDQLLGNVNENTGRISKNEIEIEILQGNVEYLYETTYEHSLKFVTINPKVKMIEDIDMRVSDIENGYKDSVRLTGANGKQYKLTIDANGALVVSEV